jgi:hypothetical protein
MALNFKTRLGYPIAGRVSVWVGDVASEEQFDAISTERLNDLLELSCHVTAISEGTVEPVARPVHDLLEGFSGYRTFIDAATSAALARGLVAANAAIVCYHLEIEEGQQPDIDGMIFIGSFDGNDRSNA